jgi:hypothetical protein
MTLQSCLSPQAYRQMQVDRLKARAKQRQKSQPLSLIEWMRRNRRMLVPDRALDLEHHPYLLDIYNCTAQQMVICKASQVGASEYLISHALHAADQRSATVLYVFPTDAHVSDFSSARIGPAIEASPYLASIVIEGGGSQAEGKRGADRVTLKRVRDRFIYLRGARVDPDGTAAQLKSIDADVLYLDELDEMDPRAPAIARKRLGHSRIAEERTVSTPTYTGRGIHAEYQASDQREWHVKCQHCGEWQPLTINQVVMQWDQLGRPVAWHGQSEGCAFVACRKCATEFDRTAPGQWIATWPGRSVAGFHLTKLCSSIVNLIDIVRALNTTDETARKECFNQDLGEPYTPRGGQITDTALDECRREYAHGPVAGEKTVMGVDVGRVLHCVIRGPDDKETGERPQRWAGEADSFDEVGRLMKRFGVKRLVIDALPETTKARELQAAWPAGVVWLAYYTTQKVGSKRAEPMQWDNANGVVNLDRTRTLDALFGEVLDKKLTLPANAREVRDYYAHLKSMVRAIEDGTGGQRMAQYIETGPDHLAHAENYCMVAAEARSGVFVG